MFLSEFHEGVGAHKQTSHARITRTGVQEVRSLRHHPVCLPSEACVQSPDCERITGIADPATHGARRRADIDTITELNDVHPAFRNTGYGLCSMPKWCSLTPLWNGSNAPIGSCMGSLNRITRASSVGQAAWHSNALPTATPRITTSTIR